MSIGLGIAISPSFEGSHIPGVSALFSYAKSSFNQGEADPTPTITGTPGGTFTGTSGIVFVDSGSSADSLTGQIDLSASSIATHTVTYTVSGVSSNFELGITAIPYQSTRSFSFDGINDYFDLGTDSTLEFSNDFTLSVWVKFTGGQSRGIFCCNKRDGGTGWQLAKNNAGKAWFFAGQRSVFSTTSINDGTWHHIACTFERDSSDPSFGNRIEIFIDGVSENVNGRGSTNAINYNLTPLYKQIGFPYVNTNYYAGNIDEVSAWDTVLSSAAITEIYNSGAPNNLESLTNASSSNLVAWYKMGE